MHLRPRGLAFLQRVAGMPGRRERVGAAVLSGHGS